MTTDISGEFHRSVGEISQLIRVLGSKWRARLPGMNVAWTGTRETTMVTRAFSRSIGLAILFVGVMEQSALSIATGAQS